MAHLTPHPATFCYVWSYILRPESVLAFHAAYGPDGKWIQLFRRDPGYIDTHLLSDCDDPTHLMTIDFWSSREAFVSFRQRFPSEFEALDKDFERLTDQELHLGDFDIMPDGF